MLHVAAREFLATVATRTFMLSVLVLPAIVAALFVVVPRLINDKAPHVEGEVAIVDPTGQIAAPVRTDLSPETLAARREAERRVEMQKVAEKVPMAGAGSPLAKIATDVPKLAVVELPTGTDLEAAKEPLKAVGKQPNRLALVVVQPNAIVRSAGNEFGTYDLYVRSKLDDRLEQEIRDAVKNAIVDARIRAQGLDRAVIESLTQVRREPSITVTATGERKTSEVFNALIPAGFMLLLLISVMSSGQYLMTTTIEEKSSRVVEILLSAVSPMQLMTGKILGQMAVGLLIMALYAGLGLAGLFQVALFGMLDLSLFFYLVIFYLIAYFVVGSLMAAIGAAVNELREAQALLMPLTILIMIPWILWMPITRNPNSAFSTAISFLPPINCFAMMLRLSSTSPPPIWQVWASIGVGLLSVWGALWFATKVFRIGLLMYGKPPNFATLVRWARMA